MKYSGMMLLYVYSFPEITVTAGADMRSGTVQIVPENKIKQITRSNTKVKW